MRPTPQTTARAARPHSCLGLLLLMLSPVLLAQSTPAPKPAATTETAIVLSPFQVDATADQGYLATQTLNGTRMRTDIKDIGSALTIFTEQMMDDLGATSINDLMAFAPNTDAFVATTGDSGGSGNDFINVGNQQFVTRGGSSSVVSQDFFASNIPNDRFNTESLTFTRGPNAILFGLGNASGAFVSSSKRAKTNRNASSFTYQVDSRGSFRGNLDHNQVIKKNLVALRYSGLYESTHTFRPPTENFQRRHYVALTVTPFAKTTLRANYEQGLINQPAVRPWPVYDAVTPYYALGAPIIPAFTNTAGGKPAGTVNYSGNLVSTQFSSGGTQIPTQNLTNTGQTAKPTFNLAGFPTNTFAVNGNNFLSLINDAIYPTFASNFGNTALRLHDYKTWSLFLEQQITKNFFVEVAFNKLSNRLTALNGVVGQQDYLFVDPNAQMPNGQPNPNVGKLYTELAPTRIDAPNRADGLRVTASYNLDFTRSKSHWLTYLGRHQAAVYLERAETNNWSSNNVTRNATPLAATGAAAAIINGANSINYRFYLEPSKGKIGTSAGANFLTFPVLYSGDKPPSGAGTGIVTPGFVAQQGLNMNSSTVKTQALATQSFFWNDRIVVTGGLRKDSNSSWRGTVGDFAALRDTAGIAPRGDGINIRDFLPGSRRDRGGHTFSRGLVVHTTPWMSLTYNSSNNLKVVDANLNVYGDILPNSQGEGQDYGVKFELLDRKVFLEAIYYSNSSINAVEQVSSGVFGDFKSHIDQTWISIFNFTKDPKYNTYPYNSIGTTWQDSVSTSSKGWELAVTANLTKRWRMVVNGSKRGANTTSARGPTITRYLAEFLPVIKSHPEWQNLNVGALNIPISQSVAELETNLANFEKVRNNPAANFNSSWTLNMVQSYDLAERLKGFSVGATMNARGPSIGGFAVDSANLINVKKPYYTPSYANFGGRIGYKRKVFNNRIDWTMQVNVRNVFDKNTIYPLFIVDKRDGKNTPSTAVYTLKEPRTYQFTSTFRF
ncbi:MAG: hypothetical protein EXS32_09045 [Opitutus sp.]|nr:hypothetical protein [Opitutus sp.]